MSIEIGGDNYLRGFTAGLKRESPMPPPTRSFKTGLIGAHRETKESIQRTQEWYEWARGWIDGVENVIKKGS